MELRGQNKNEIKSKNKSPRISFSIIKDNACRTLLMMKMLLKENNHQNVFKSIHHQLWINIIIIKYKDIARKNI